MSDRPATTGPGDGGPEDAGGAGGSGGSGGSGDRPPGAGLIGWFVDNPVAANLLMLFFILSGVVTALTMPTEVFPTIAPSSVQVSVVYPGATPDDVEESITRRVEEAVLGLDGVDRVRSTASEGVGRITVELQDFADPQIVKDDVQTAVDALADFPPEDAEQPQIRVPQPVTTVLTLAITGPVDEAALREAGEQVERDLLTQPAVSTVQLRGVRRYEISIALDEPALRRYGLSFTDVANRVRASSVDLSGGEIRAEGGEILLRTNARRETGEEFAQIVLRALPDGSRVFLGDVAEVTDGFQDEPLITLFNGEPAVFVDVQVQGAEDLLDVRAGAVAYLEEARLPPGLEIVLVSDQSEIFRDRISLLVRNAILGFTLVFLLLVLMLDLRLAFWVAMGVPISFLGGFALFGAAGVTLNFVTTFGLIIVLGIVVDDAIVVGENTDRARAKGKSDVAAAIEGVRGVAPPVLVGVLTTMAAFGPLIFSGGEFAQITRPVPIVVICILAVSLVEAFFILPSHLSHGGNWSRGPLARLQALVADRVNGFSDGPVRAYARVSSRLRYLTALLGVIALAGMISLAATGVVRFVFFPNIEAEQITADLALPDGAPFEATEAAARRMIAAVERLNARYEEEAGGPVIEAVSATIGGRTSLFGGPGSTVTTTIASNLAQIELQLTPASQRAVSSSQLEREWRDETGAIPGAERLTIVSSAGPQDADIAYEMAHPDDQALARAVETMAARLAEIDGVSEIEDGYDLGKRQFEFALTPAGEAAGLTPGDVARQVRQAFFGEEVQRIQRGRDEVRVFVRYPDRLRTDLASLRDFRLRAPDGAEIPLGVAAEITETRSFTSIERIDGRRILEVTADVDEAVTTPGEARERVEAEILPELEEAYPGLRWRIAGAGREQQQDFASLQRGLMIALVIMYALLATQLKSYVQPLVILMAVPFGIGGAILGHMALGYDLSFVSIFGMVALSGVVVNASIVMVDRYNRNVASGMDLTEAVAEAAGRRFRPIMITTLTTALGLLPIMSETSPQAQFLIPMAVSLGMGLLFASVLILLVLPAFILIVEDLRGLLGGGAKARAGREAPAE